jgi:hypothetical protein
VQERVALHSSKVTELLSQQMELEAQLALIEKEERKEVPLDLHTYEIILN